MRASSKPPAQPKRAYLMSFRLLKAKKVTVVEFSESSENSY